MPLIRARSVVQVHPGPPFVSVGTGCCPTNLNPQASPHFTAPFTYPRLTPSDIPPAPPVFHRSPPACTDRASSESLRDAGCEVRTVGHPRYALRPSLPPVADDRRRK